MTVWTDVDGSTLPSGTRARSHAHTPGGSQHLCSWKTNTDGNAGQHTESKRPVVHLHTQTAPNVWWETPVAVWLRRCQRCANRGQLLTRQIYGCYSSSAYVYVCVRGSLLGLPSAKPSLPHLLFLRTSSLSLSADGLMRSPTSLILPEFLTEQREKRKIEESWAYWPSLIPIHLGSVKTPLKYWQWQMEQ